MNLLATIESIMTREVITLHPRASIYEVGELFDKYHFHHIPVVEGDKLVGMVSKSDYLFFKRGFLTDERDKKMEEIRLKNYEVSFIMTRALGKLEKDDKVNVALEIFRKNYFHALPVLEEDRLVGIVTTLDIIEHLAADAEVIAQYDI